MSEKKTLKFNFNNIRLNQKELSSLKKEEARKSKERIDPLSVNVDQIVVFNQFKHNNKCKNVELLNHYALFYLK